jgi:hypothetical protein
MARSIRKLVGKVLTGGGERPEIPDITDIAVSGDGAMLCQLREGKWVRGRFVHNGEQPTRVTDDEQRQAHVYGRKGDLPVAVEVGGAASHGERGRLQPVDADALRDLGFKVPADGVVQWTAVPGPLRIQLD